jgi:drug/metabolite transporter (DMT)-like permease
MDHDSEPIALPTRSAAGVLGTAYGLFGILCVATAIAGINDPTVSFTSTLLVSLLALAVIAFAAVFIRAAIRGRSPTWPN